MITNNEDKSKKSEKMFTQIRDLKIALKDMEPYIRGVKHLITGREFTNFSLRLREVLGIWFVCVVGNYNGYNLTFQEDPTGGDGIIFNIDTKGGTYTEHVSAINNLPNAKPVANSDDFILEKIQDKIDKGKNNDGKYRNKMLVVFIEGMGNFHPLKIAREINGMHDFSSVWIFALESNDEEYRYIVIQLSTYLANPLIYKVHIAENFESWTVEVNKP